MTTTFKVDYECNAEFFWDNARTEARKGTCPDALKPIIVGHPVLGTSDAVHVDDKDLATLCKDWLRGIDGWSDPEYPAHAPHPVIVGVAVQS